MIRVLRLAHLQPEDVVDLEHHRLALLELVLADLLEVNAEDGEDGVEDDHHDREVDDAVRPDEGEVPGREDAHDDFPEHRQHVVPDDVVQELLRLGPAACRGGLRRAYLGGGELEVAEEEELEVDLVLFGLGQQFLVLAGGV